ncbi:MAG: hypothetical protein ABJC62_12410 [Frankiaceae bacterium]
MVRAVGGNLRALNPFNRDTGTFTDESEHLAQLFASHDAVAMAGAQQQAHLRMAMDTGS